MFRRLEELAPEILAGARILVGTLFACDGAQKVLGVFGGTPVGAPAAIVFIAGGIELCVGALLAGGLFARAAFSFGRTAATTLGGGTRRPNESIVSQ